MFDSPYILNNIFDTIGIGICVTDEDGYYINVNQQYCQLYGFTKEELIGQLFTIIISPERREEALQIYKKMIEDDTYHYPTKWERIRKDGTSLYTATSGYNSTLENGKKVRTTIVRDISQIIESQDQIEFQAKILQNVKDGVIVTDFAGKVLYWNEAAVDMFGLSQDEMIGSDIRNFNPNYDGNLFLQHLHQETHSFDNEWHYTRSDGTGIWVYGRITPLYDNFQNIIGFIGVSKDITHKKKIEQERESLLKEAQLLNEKLRASEEELRQNLDRTIELNEFIRKSERRFKSLTEKSFDAIMMYDEQGSVIYASPSAENILGYTCEELIGRKGPSFVHQDELTEANSLVLYLYKKPGERIHLEHRARKKDNTFIWVEVIMTNLLHDESVRGVISNFRDITEKKEAEQRLIENEASLNMAQQIAKLGSWELTLETNEVKWSQGFYKILELDKEKQPESTVDFYQYVHPSDRQKAKKLMAAQLKEEKELSFELKLISATGRLKYIKVMSKFLHNETGKPVKLIGTIQDITEQKKAEQEISNYGERLRLATQASHIGIWDWNIKKNQLLWDDQMFGLYGIQKEYITYEDWFDAIHPDDARNQEVIIQQVLEQDLRYDSEFRIVLPSGEIRWIKSFAKNFYDEKQKPVRMIGASWDITQLKETEENLRQNNEELLKTNNELDHFVYSTSHNLRAPLTSILGIIELLKNYSKPEEYAKYLHLIEKSIIKLDETIHEITDYSKNTRTGLRYEKIHFESLISSVVDSMSLLEDTEKISLITDIPVGLDFVSDSIRLKVVFNNLISNTIKYYNPYQQHPYIKISILKTDQGITIHFQDNGIGIAKEHVDKIFDMFFRASHKSTGSGLGLYIVKEAVHKLQGTIKVHSTIGEGTEFIIYLPDLRQKL